MLECSFFFPSPRFFSALPNSSHTYHVPLSPPPSSLRFIDAETLYAATSFSDVFPRVYAIEGEFFAHTDLCIPHSLSFSIASARFHLSAWLPSLLPTCIRPLSTFVDGSSE